MLKLFADRTVVYSEQEAMLHELRSQHFTSGVVAKLLETGGRGVFHLYKDNVSDAVLLNEAEKDSALSALLPRRLQSPDLPLKLVEHDPQQIFSLHTSSITREIASTAFALDGSTFGAIPRIFKTAEMYLEACANNIFWADKYSRELQDAYVAAYENNPANMPDWLNDQTLLQALKEIDWKPEPTAMKLAS